jgi:hypothetical protein
MIININAPSTFDTLAGRVQAGTLLPGELSKVDELRFGSRVSTISRFINPLNTFTNPLSGPVGFLLDLFLQGGNRAPTALYRSTRRIAESIALYMPNGGLVYTEDNKYEEVSMTALSGSVISGAASSIFGANSAIVSVIDTIGSVVTTGSQLAGYPVNPQVEVLFATRPMREWMFEVLLAPRNEEESDTVHEIIRTMRLYSAPELTGGGFFLIPPAEFDITFYRNGKENEYLPRINTCVLKRFEVDYAPAEGKYSTFSTGAPVAVRMSMNFQEVEMLHKKRVAQGF